MSFRRAPGSRPDFWTSKAACFHHLVSIKLSNKELHTVIFRNKRDEIPLPERYKVEYKITT